MKNKNLLIVLIIAVAVVTATLTACSDDSKAEVSTTTEITTTEVAEEATTSYDAEDEQLEYEYNNLPRQITYTQKIVATQSVVVRDSSYQVMDYLQYGDRVYFTGAVFKEYAQITYFIGERKLEGWVFDNTAWFS